MYHHELSQVHVFLDVGAYYLYQIREETINLVGLDQKKDTESVSKTNRFCGLDTSQNESA